MYDRKSPRHPQFDDRSLAAYFVTLCAHGRASLFGEVVEGEMVLNPFGRTVAEGWHRSEMLRDTVVLDAFVCMPNHLHGIVCIVPSGTRTVSPRGYRLGDHAVFGASSPPPSDGVGAPGGAPLPDGEGRTPRTGVPDPCRQ